MNYRTLTNKSKNSRLFKRKHDKCTMLLSSILMVGCLLQVAYGQLNITLDKYQGQPSISAGKTITLKSGFSVDGGKQSRIFIDGSIPPTPDEFTVQGSGAQGTAGSNLGKAATVGNVQGKAEVSSNGAAIYTIPIKVLTGIAGAQPSLGLSYNSAGGDGLAGWGWSINGMSMISRAGKSKYYSGQARSVNYTNSNDAFVLDGERLSALSGLNGGNGTVYGTEKENFAKIESFGGTEVSGPDWFRVTTKGGQIMEYGKSANSRFLTNDGQSTMFWFLSKVVDINGNSVVYGYYISQSDRCFALTSIGYLSNENTGEVPKTLVELIYSVRSNWQGTAIYEGGASVNRPYNLDKINIKDLSGNTVKTYQCSYTQNGSKYLLGSVKETGTDGKELTPTVFTYGDEVAVPDTKELYSNINFQKQIYIGDYDGDGKRDLMAETYKYDNDGQTRYTTHIDIYSDYSANGGASVLYREDVPVATEIITVQKTDIKNGFYNIVSGDYDGDGKDDILKIKSKLVSFSGYKPMSTITGINVTSINSGQLTGTARTYSTNATDRYGRSYIYIPPDKSCFYPGDFDGDGLADYILLLGQFSTAGQPSSGIIYKAFFSSPGKYIFNREILGLNLEGNSSSNYTSTSLVTADRMIPADFNGDGKTDLMVTKDNITYFLSIEPGNSVAGYYLEGKVLSTTNTITKDNIVFMGDFNGDKKMDLLVRGANGKKNWNEPWQILMGTGAGNGFPFSSATTFSFGRSVTLPGDDYAGKFLDAISNIQIADFDGDGKTDIGAFYSRVSNNQVYGMSDITYMDGVNSFRKTYNTDNSRSDFVLADDMDGDGRADIVTATGWLSIYYMKPFSNENMLVKVTEGSGYTTKFNYRELTRRIADIPNSPASYLYYIRNADQSRFPFNLTALGIKPVSTMQVSNGLGGVNTFFYRYEDAVLHREGKGMLGFKKMTVYDQSTGLATVKENDVNTIYAELYPVRQYTLGNYYLPYNTGDMLSEQKIMTSYKSRPYGTMSQRYLVQIDNTISIDYVTGAAAQSSNTYDDYGNVTTAVSAKGFWNGSSVSQTESQTTVVGYGVHNTPVPALPDNSTVKSTRSGQVELVRTTSMRYDTKGNIIRKIDFDGKPNAVTTDMEYDTYGNLVKTTFSASGMNNRIVKSTYDAQHRFEVKKDAIGSGITRTTSSTYDIWGNALSTTSSDGTGDDFCL